VASKKRETTAMKRLKQGLYKTKYREMGKGTLSSVSHMTPTLSFM
jgi:hypothetical protein